MPFSFNPHGRERTGRIVAKSRPTVRARLQRTVGASGGARIIVGVSERESEHGEAARREPADGSDSSNSSATPDVRVGSAGPGHGSWVRTIIRFWPLSIALPLAAGVAGYFLAGMAPSRYTASAVVVSAPALMPDVDAEQLRMSWEDLSQFFTAPEVVETALRELGLDPSSRNTVARGLEVTPSGGEQTRGVTVRLKMSDPERVQMLANAIARIGARQYRTHMRSAYDDTLTRLRAKAEQADQTLQEAEKELAQLEATSRLATRRAEVSELRDLMQDRQRRIHDTGLAKDGLAARIAELSEALEDLEPTITLQRKLVDVAPMMEAAEPPEEPEGAADRMALDLDVTVQNSTYWQIFQSLQQAQAALAERNSELAVARSDVESASEELKRKEEALPDLERKHQRAERVVERARSDSAQRFATLRRVEAIPVWPPQHLTVLERAEPARPVSPNRRAMALLALLGCGLVTWPLSLWLGWRARPSETGRSGHG